MAVAVGEVEEREREGEETSHNYPSFRRKEGKPRNNSSEKRSTKRPFFRSTLYYSILIP